MKKKNLLMTAIAIFGLATTTKAQVPSYVPTNGLIGWWPFNGNTNDESGNGNNGSILGGATLAQDRFNNLNTAYEIDGINCPNAKGISLPSNINNTGAYSISIWFQTMDSTKTVQNIFNSFPHQYIGVNFNYPYTGFQNKTCSFWGNGTWQVNGSTINWNTYNLSDWHNIIVVKNTSSISYYQDGVLKFSLPMQPSYNSGAFTSIVIGAISINGGSGCYETFKGKLDDVAIWNRDLTQQEITDLYNGCQLSVSTQPASQNININNNVQFIVGSSDLNATYQWQTDLGVGFQNLNSVGQYSGTTNDTLTVSNLTISNNNQPFRCIVSSGSCSDTSNVAVLTVNNNVGINENSQYDLFSVFPNPAQSVINIKADSKLIGKIYTIFDNTGKVILTGKLTSQNTSIDLDNLSGGIYMFSVEEHMKQTFKIIKQ
jgi:hypothetical protein